MQTTVKECDQTKTPGIHSPPTLTVKGYTSERNDAFPKISHKEM